MPDPNPIAQLRRRLVELGCPPKALRRIVREAAEHFDDLRRAAEAQGLSPDEAAIRAEEQWGDPGKLAERHMEVLRKSSWPKQHILWGVVVASLALIFEFYYLWMYNGGRMPDFVIAALRTSSNPLVFRLEYYGYNAAILASTAFISFLVFRKIQRQGAKPIWSRVAAVLLCAHGLLLQFEPVGIAMFGNLLTKEVTDPVLRSAFAGIPRPQDFAAYAEPPPQEPDWNTALTRDENAQKYSEYINQTEDWEKRRQQRAQQFAAPFRAMEAAHRTEIEREITNTPRPSFSDPGWTLNVSYPTAFSADNPYASHYAAYLENRQLPHPSEVEEDNQGKLFVRASFGDIFTLPVAYYGLLQPGRGATLHWLNVAMPLLVYLAFQIRQHRVNRRILSEPILAYA